MEYNKETHWLLKLASNECAKLENEVKSLKESYLNVVESNKRLRIQNLSLEQQLGNAFQLNDQLRDQIADILN